MRGYSTSIGSSRLIGHCFDAVSLNVSIDAIGGNLISDGTEIKQLKSTKPCHEYSVQSVTKWH